VRRLRSQVSSVAELLELTERVVPCLEVLDDRYQATDVDLVDDIADNCAAAGLLLGDGVETPPEDELLAVRVEMGASADTAILAPAISPVRATLWLANRVVQESGELEPGALLLSSACCPSLELVPGVEVSADFGGLGALALHAAAVVSGL
jgi:2-keto-4-pentenoate hydratase